MSRFTKTGLLTCLLVLLLTGCGVGDDNGERLGDYIVGTWQRGWNPGDVIIEGNTNHDDDDEDGGGQWTPERFSYDKFIFSDDGTYNGMVRTGSMCVLGKMADTIFVGDYKCDNNNMKMNVKNQDGLRQTILARVVSFTQNTMVISYEAENLGVSGIHVQMTLRKEE